MPVSAQPWWTVTMRLVGKMSAVMRCLVTHGARRGPPAAMATEPPAPIDLQPGRWVESFWRHHNLFSGPTLNENVSLALWIR